MAELNGKEKFQLSDDELGDVYGGQGSNPHHCVLTGPYWDNSKGEGAGKTDLIGKPNVFAQLVSYAQGSCKYKITQNNIEKGWTIISNITFY